MGIVGFPSLTGLRSFFWMGWVSEDQPCTEHLGPVLIEPYRVPLELLSMFLQTTFCDCIDFKLAPMTKLTRWR